MELTLGHQFLYNPRYLLVKDGREIDEILDSGSENLALFFDTTKRTGWYIPQISLALQMIHAIISMRKYRIYDGDNEISEGDNCHTFAQSGPDAATEAAMPLKNCLRFRIKKNQFSKSKTAFEDFGDMFERVWDTLSNVEAGLESAEGGFRLAGHVAPKFIHGVEFLDTADMKPTIRIKTAEVDQAWAHLTSEHPLVIFSRDIEPPIAPEQSNLCGPWQVVPSKQSYLVSMGLAIIPILDRRREGLADGSDWNFRTDLIQTHNSGRTVPVKHVQKLVSRKKPRSNSPIRREILKYPTGCFVFGPDAESECKESTVAPRDHLLRAGAASVAASPTMLTLGKQTQVSSTMEIRVEVPVQPASTSKHRNSAAIRLMEGQKDPQYVFNGPSHSADLGSRSLDGSAQSKRTPRIKSALDKLLSKKQEKGLPSKLLEQAEQAELERLGSESAVAGEYDDLDDA